MNENSHSNPPSTRDSGFVQWLQDPLGSIIAASIASIGSFGVVVSGIWFVNLAVT